MSVMLCPCMLCVALLICLFVLCVACLTVFMNCLVKQCAMCLSVVAILLLNVMDVFSVCDGSSSVLCLLIVKGMYVVVNVMLSLMSVMIPPPALCNLSVRTTVKLCILGVLALGVSLVS